MTFNIKQKSLVLLTSSILTLILASPVLSQDGSAVLEEIVVTAQKRAQNINDVPVAIQAFSGQDLVNNGVTDAETLVQVVPGLTFAKSPTNTPIFTIRGVGFNTSNLSSTSTIGLYVDEVAYAYPYMTNGALFDVERVEVLKGPQGTLYGRNTTGGLVNFITNKPGEEFESGVTVEVGEFETTNVEGFVSIPLSETAGVRIAGRIDRSREGFQESVSRPGDKLGEQDMSALRAIFLWNPSDRLSLQLSASYWEDNSDSVAGQIVGLNPDVPDFVPGSVAAVDLNRQWDNDIADWDAGDGPFGNRFETDSDFTGLAARLEYDINDRLSLVSLTGFNDVNRRDGNDFDGTAEEIFHLDSIGEVESFSQEFRLVGNGDNYNYIIGAYFSNDDIVDNQLGSYSLSSQGEFLRFLSQNVFDPTNQFFTAEEYADGFRLFRLLLDSESTSRSIFGKFEYDINETLNLSIGLRYTDDELEAVSCSADFEGNSRIIWNTAVFAIGGNDLPGPVEVDGCMTLTPDFSAIADPDRTPLEEDNVSGRLSLSYIPHPDLLLFGSVSVGYKSGAWPVLTAASSDQLDAATQEKVTAYEIGAKATLLDGRAQLNGSLFFYDYEDKQLLSEVEDLVFTTLPRLVNIPESEVYGAELDFDMQISGNLRTRLSAAYTKSEVTRFSGFRRLGEFEDFAGDEFPYTPEWQFTGLLGYDTPITSALKLTANVSGSYQSDSSATIGREEGFDIDSYALINTDVSIANVSETWKLGLYVNNLTDEYYWTSVDVQTDAIYRIPGRPRTFGLRLNLNF